MDTKRLAGKNILITGAAQGMGASNAIHFAAQGANICLGDLDLGLAQKVTDEINAHGNGKAIAVQMDVTKREDTAAAVAHCRSLSCRRRRRRRLAAAVATVAHGEGVEMGMSSETKSRPVALRSAAARRIEERVEQRARSSEAGA